MDVGKIKIIAIRIELQTTDLYLPFRGIFMMGTNIELSKLY